MKKLWIFFCLLLGLIVYGCDSQPIPTSPIGNIGHISSRNLTSPSVLDAGSRALFNASGGLAFANEIFVFTGSQWESTNVSLSPNHSKTTNLTALYPAYDSEQDNILITSNPYIENALTDVLIAKSTFTSETEIDLEFKHLFAKLTLHVASSLADKINQIEVIAPKVTSINGIDGSFTVSTNETHSTLLSKDESGAYSCILPTIENCNLTIIINPGENEIKHTLTHNFESGYKYECNITDTDTRPGIRTAEDLIDFSRLINGKNSIYGKALSDFEETVNGRTTYRLLADLTLTEEQSKVLLPIGYSETKAFQYIFDGEGHRISNLIIPDESFSTEITKDYSGLFGSISTNGIVRNLHIYNANTTSAPISSPIGGIAARNSGLIENCSVQNSTFNEISKVGGICGSLSKTGYIINCYTTNNTFNIKSASINGGIAGDANGYIINCYSYNNSYKNTVSGSHNGGIAGQSTTGKIHNCYTYQAKIPNYWGSLLGLYNSGTIMRNFFYNNCKYIVFNIQQESSKNAQIYDSTFNVGETHISTLLNDWISTTGKIEFPETEYPNIVFKEWILGDDGSAIFEE